MADSRGSARRSLASRTKRARTYSSCSHGSAYKEAEKAVKNYCASLREAEGRLTIDPDIGDVGAAKVADVLRDLGALLLQLVVHCVRQVGPTVISDLHKN